MSLAYKRMCEAAVCPRERGREGLPGVPLLLVGGRVGEDGVGANGFEGVAGGAVTGFGVEVVRLEAATSNLMEAFFSAFT